MARILIIDDESNIRLMLRLALMHAGHTPDTAEDGYAGLDKWGDGSGWDLALLDQRMPGLTGIEVLRQMRERTPNARVILITAFGTVDLATDAMKLGATDFLRKPFTLQTLNGAVEAALYDRLPPHEEDVLFPLSFERATVNGYRIASPPGVEKAASGAIADTFTVWGGGQEATCRVSLPAYLPELVRAHADRDEMPGGDAFWQALCGEALANYLWQNAEPPGETLQVEDLTSGLRHWIDAILTRAED